MDLKKALPILLPRAIEWAERQSQRILTEGAPLAPDRRDVASRLGVAHPDRIRCLIVHNIPLPEDPALAHAGVQTGLFGPYIGGMTLGYGIYLREAGRDGRSEVLARECRHVQQYEAHGSIAAFLREYLEQLVTFGFHEAPLEIDARVAAAPFR